MLKQQQLRLATLTGTRGGEILCPTMWVFLGLGVIIPELSKSFSWFSPKMGPLFMGIMTA
jgi:hypothetical protein